MTGHDLFDGDLERQLRESLRREADRISPRDRQGEILAIAHDQSQIMTEPSRRWLIPVGAAASVALIGAVAWGVTHTGKGPLGAPAASPSVATSPVATSPPAATSPASTAPATSKPAPSAPSSNGGATTQVALPAYFVGANSGTGDRFGLYREFVRTTVPAGATPGQKAKAAVAAAMNAQPFTNVEPYVQPWSGTTVQDVTVAPSLITIRLSGSGAATGFSAEQTRLAVQELVWTAQAAIAQGIPVKFAVADGSAKLFDTYSTDTTYNRPAKDQQYQDLAPIWITFPDRDQVIPAGTSLLVKGESCAFEATTQWQLKKSGTTVKSGTTMASSGCPNRGTWQVNLGSLGAGTYLFRMYEISVQDGQGVVAETSKPFTVK